MKVLFKIVLKFFSYWNPIHNLDEYLKHEKLSSVSYERSDINKFQISRPQYHFERASFCVFDSALALEKLYKRSITSRFLRITLYIQLSAN